MIDFNHLSSQEKATADQAPAPENRVELMDVHGLAEFLHLDRQTIYNWLHQRKLSGIKVGGVWRFDKRVVEEWLRAQTVDGHMSRATRHKRHEPQQPLE